MGLWTIELTNPAFVIAAHAAFDLRTQSTWGEDGKPQFVETFIEVEGDIVDEDDPAVVADRQVILRNQVAASLNPRDVTLKLDGVTKFQFLRSASIGSPRVEFHAALSEEEGSGEEHWPFRLQIYVKTPPTNSDIIELETSIKTIKEGKKTVRKIWIASAKGKTLAAALARVLQFKPSDPQLHEEIERQFQQRRANAIWVWETRKKGTVTEIIEEPITVTGFGNVFFPTKQAGDPSAPLGPITPAVLHRGRLDAFKIVVRGVVRGHSPTEVRAAVPGAHFTESSTLKRNEQEETRYLDVKLIDPIKGIWELPYNEVWIGTNIIPKPNHKGHKPKDPPECISAPGDGAMASQGA